MESIDPYGLCPCGSGKKYKFCCLQKLREKEVRESRPSFWSVSSSGASEMENPDTRGIADAQEGFRLCEKGLRLMAEGKFEQAVPLFREAIAVAPAIYTAANNLSLCLFVTDNLEEAIRVQSESRSASPFPNPFGWANLATFHLVAGDEAGAQRDLDEMMRVALPSVDACVKVCETLARFGRHQAILDAADKSGYASDPGVCFFTGVAAANLGDRRRAEQDLRRVTLGHHKADMTRRYLQCLRDGTSPHTIRGDWPYLLPYEVCPKAVIEAELKRDEASWISRRIAVDVCEVVLNESADKPDNAINVLACAKHPEAIALLWLIAKGTFGPDSLRLAALQSLQERGALAPSQNVEVFLDGERRALALTGTRLDPEFRFGKQLPKALEKLYEKAVMAGCQKRPDWAAIGETCLKIVQEAPDYFPARYNYAVSLLYRNRMDEAERILRELVAEQPDYLFAHATLLQLLCKDGHMKEAGAFLKSTAVPKETHPDAMSVWLVAQALYHKGVKDFTKARDCIRSAHVISPDKPNVKRLWQESKEWET